MQLNNMSDNMAAAVVATYPSPAHLLAVSTPPLPSLQTSDTLCLLWAMKARSVKGSFQVSGTFIFHHLLHVIKLVVWEAGKKAKPPLSFWHDSHSVTNSVVCLLLPLTLFGKPEEGGHDVTSYR